MPYIVRSKKTWTGSGMSLIAAGPREALDHANDLIERGALDVEVIELGGEVVELANLEAMAKAIEADLN